MEMLKRLLTKLGKSNIAKKIADNPKTSAATAVGAPVAAYGAHEGLEQYKDLKKKEIILQNLGKGAAMGGMAGLGMLIPKILEHPTTKSFLGQTGGMADKAGSLMDRLSPEDLKRLKAMME